MVLFALGGCRAEPTAPGDEADGDLATPALAISDGAHGGSPHFFFLPPLARAPRPAGTFDPGLTPTVTICALNAQGCARTIATYTVNGGPGGERIVVHPAEEHYAVKWKTREFNLRNAVNYRVTVSVGEATLGFVDVDLVRSEAGLRNVDTDEYVGLVNGRTLPIRFRVESGAVGGILISPESAEVGVGDQIQFSATLLDGGGQQLPPANLMVE